MELKIKIEIDGEWHEMTWHEICEAISFGNDLSNSRKRIWTGLKDKNGIEMYEGDIVEADGITYEVIHNPRNASFCLKAASHYAYFDDDVTVSDITVIGNIYQHQTN